MKKASRKKVGHSQEVRLPIVHNPSEKALQHSAKRQRANGLNGNTRQTFMISKVRTLGPLGLMSLC